ncbi:elongator complex protein 6-like [Saccostrea echinata]|uniref:elongator complex protein 6-like n=1 Tax=Saccostrea echinata TaxID=191078 RepID=UPI002A7EC05F|nr:elongator complex protein 6-like [Saccostrea echinata]
MEEVNNVLDISKDDKLYGDVITLSDSSADGTFLLHHFLSFFLSSNIDRHVCFVSLTQSFGHQKSVCQKLGINLTQKIESSQLKYCDVLKAFGNRLLDIRSDSLDCVNSFDSLQGVYEMIKASYLELQNKRGDPPVVIVDNLNVLLNIGYHVKEISAFIQYLCQLISAPESDCRGTLVMFISTGEDSADEEANLVWKRLLHLSNLDVHVSGLESGYCKDVHGKIEVKRRNCIRKKNSKSMQFKVNEKSVNFFASGMSKAVLG